MEKIETLVSELTQGRECTFELKNQLNPTKNSREACGFLVEKILSSYDNALAMLNCMAFLENENSSQVMLETTNSIEGSPRSEGSKNVSKKRKAMPRWSKQVRVSSETGSEGLSGDGYNWRKYGQKDILGTNHPRAYYRCTHRNTQGCLATKQVQRVEEDPSVFEVIYRGNHTCIHERVKPEKENPNPPKKQRKSKIDTQPSLKAEIQELDSKLENFPSFSFPSTPIESQNTETQFFSEPNNFEFMGTSYSSPFLSPVTSESYFSQCHVNDFAEIMSNPTPITNLPFGDLDFSIGQVDFDPHFLDGSDFF